MFTWVFKRACQYLVDILGGLARHNKRTEETDSGSYFYTPTDFKGYSSACCTDFTHLRFKTKTITGNVELIN